MYIVGRDVYSFTFKVGTLRSRHILLTVVQAIGWHKITAIHCVIEVHMWLNVQHMPTTINNVIDCGYQLATIRNTESKKKRA